MLDDLLLDLQHGVALTRFSPSGDYQLVLLDICTCSDPDVTYLLDMAADFFWAKQEFGRLAA